VRIGIYMKTLKKLKELTSKLEGERTIQYKYGLSISFFPSKRVTWISDGEIISDDEIG